MILGQEEKPSLEDIVEHYGVKGMQWGKRKARVTGQQIRDARREIRTREQDVNSKAVRLNDLTGSGASKAQVNRATKDLDAAIKGLTTSDARVNSLRYTNGEKAVLILFAGPFAALPIATLAAGRKFEQKQVDKARAASKT